MPNEPSRLQTHRLPALVLGGALVLAACSQEHVGGAASVDAGADLGTPAPIDAAADLGPDAAVDASPPADASDDVPLPIDRPDVPRDTGGPVDAATDARETSACGAGETVCGGGCVDVRSDARHCGACGVLCPTTAHALPSCVASTCRAVCEAGYVDCDGDLATGCEAATATSIEHCGACGMRCPTAPNTVATCVAGACRSACATGYADCDGNPANGCEVDVRASSEHCGGCGRACVAGRTCRSGVCATARHAAFVFAPSAATLHVYATAAAAVQLSYDTGEGTPIALPTLTFGRAGARTSSVPIAGLVRAESDTPFVLWAHDGTSGDQLVTAAAIDGSMFANELFTWSSAAVNIITGSRGPTRVLVQRVGEDGTLTEVEDWSMPYANMIHPVNVGTSAVYRIVSTGEPVMAFGHVPGVPYSHFAYLPSEGGTFRGTAFRYTEPGAASDPRRLVVQTLDAEADLTYLVTGSPTTIHVRARTATRSSISSGNLLTVRSSTPVLAWVEAAGGTCGAVLDTDLVPSTFGRTYATEWMFQTTGATAPCRADRQSDVDVIAHADGTSYTVSLPDTVSPPITGVLDRGQRARVLTDLAPGRQVNIRTTRSAVVQMSHYTGPFAIRAASIPTVD